MIVQFDETFSLTMDKVFPYFRSPAEWVKLYGEVKPTKDVEDGWFGIALKNFPFPLKARVVFFEESSRVRWEFGGFWRGIAEINFKTEGDCVRIEGFEYLIPFGAWYLGEALGNGFIQDGLERIWALGWRRLRKHERPSK